MEFAKLTLSLPFRLDSFDNIKKFMDCVEGLFPEENTHYLCTYRAPKFVINDGYRKKEFDKFADFSNAIYRQEHVDLLSIELYNTDSIFLSYEKANARIITLMGLDQKKLEICEKEIIKNLNFHNDDFSDILKTTSADATSTANDRAKKIFISHATNDCEYAKQLVNLLVHMGIRETDQIFCSSIGGTGIPLREHIYNYIKREFQQFDIYVIMLLSENYYHSPACLNEMGATWILDLPDMPILLPGFSFSQIEGAEDNRRIAIKLDADDISEKLLEFRDTITTFFDIAHTNSASEINIWSRHQKEFIDAVRKLTPIR